MVTRWRIAILLSAAIAISYLDRQALSVAITAVQRDIPLSNVQFSHLQVAFLLAYALMYAGGGALVDALGTKRGLLVIMIAWSLATMAQGLATGFRSLLVSRFLLGMGEGGGFPAATKAVSEHFPANERSTAMGIINAGTAVGAVVAPPAIAAILGVASWRWVFVATGATGLVWAIWWVRDSKSPATPVEPVARSEAGVGCLVGGWFSSWLLTRGSSVNMSRKVALGASAALMPLIVFVTYVPTSLAIVLFSIAFFGQQSWSTLVMIVPTDLFDRRVVASVAGLVGFGGAMGGVVFNLVVGRILDSGLGYGMVFGIVGSFHVIAFAVILLTIPVIRPLDPGR